ncbi:MAG: hypothetical protein OXE99_11135, partial [Cellvibrionales bacterium]|nr:hypothetical protein [Cellvibrionales bacterium]
SWSSETPAATVYQDDAGLVFFSTTTAEAVGISATHASFESEAKTGTGMFTANGTLPNSVAFSPAGFSTVFTGQTKQYTLTGTWDDGSDGITHNVSWNSVDSTVAAFTGNTTSSTLSSRQDGLLTGVSASTEGTQISALCGAEVLGEPQTVIVRELVIEGIKIYKEGDPIAKDAYDITLGRTDTFRAEAVYAGGDVDGAALDITQDCYWESEEPNANAIQVGNAELVSNPTTEQKKGSIKGVSLTENMTPDNYAGLRVTLKSCRGQSDCESTVVQIRVKQ